MTAPIVLAARRESGWREAVRRWRPVVVAGWLAALGCSEQLTFETARVTSVVANGTGISSPAGSSVTVSVTVRDQRGRGVPGQSVTFTPSAGTVASASATSDGSGVATATWTPGTTAGPQTITAAVPAASVSVQVSATITPGPAATGTINRTSANVDALTDTVRFDVTNVRDAFNNAITGASLTWVSSDTTVASLVSPGLFRSRGNGTATISARVGTTAVATASFTVAQVATALTLTPARSRVVAVNDTLRLTLAATDRLGQAIASPSGITYSTSNAAAVAVPVNTSPVVRAAGTGRATITATRGTVTASVLVAAGAATPTRVVATVDSARVTSTSRTLTLQAQTTDQDTIPMTGRTFTFTSLQPSVATVVAATGVVTSETGGLAGIVIADAAGGAIVPDTVPFRVVQVPASIVPSADTVRVPQSDTAAFTSIVRDSAGATIPSVFPTVTSGTPGTATVSVTAGTTRVAGIAAGAATLTLTAGTAPTVVTRTVVARVDAAARWKQIVGLGYLMCGLTTGDELYCWGGSSHGSNGFGGTNKDSSSVAPRRPLNTATLRFAQLAVAGEAVCALQTSATGGDVYCWGAGARGELGVSPTSLASFACGTFTCRYRNSPLAISSSFKFSSIQAQRQGFCGIVATGATPGRVACWGENFGQQLGIPSGTADTLRTLPVLITDTTTFTRIAGTNDTFCGVAARDNLTYCWGGAAWGIKGAGQAVTTGNAATYTHLTSQLSASLVFASFSTTAGQGSVPVHCGIAAGQAYCWGYNGWGTLGTGAVNTLRNVPTAVTGIPGTVTSVSSSGFHTCATNTAGEVYCWGANSSGQLGSTVTANCVGGGADPQYGFASQPLITTTCAAAPVRVPTSLTFTSVVASGQRDVRDAGNTCALRPSGVAYCWGAGALGSDGPATIVPRLVAAPAN